jgi:type IV pilus assembly protein PilM
LERVVDKKVLINKFMEFIGVDTDPILGLDIGSTAVKIIGLTKVGDKIKLEFYAFEPLEPGAVVEKNIKDREKVVNAIKAVVKKAKIASTKVCVAIPSATSITKIIQLSSDLSDKEIGSEIDFEAERYIPYPLEDVNLDYSVVGPVKDNAELVNVLLAVSKSENIENIVDLVSDAGLVALIVDIDSFAIERAFELVANKLPEHGKNKVVAVFDIGATITTMNVFDHNSIVYTREQGFGGQHLIDEIQNIYGLTYPEAIAAIKNENLPADYYQEVLEPFMQTVAQQINRFCQFFFSSGNYTTIDYIFLTGGGSSIKDLDILIQSKLQIKTFIADPFSDFTIPSGINQEEFKRDIPRLMCCCGLALRNLATK